MGGVRQQGRIILCVYDYRHLRPLQTQCIRRSDDWLWDDLVFDTAIIRDYTDIQLKANEDITVTVTGAPRAAGIYFKRSEDAADIAVSLNGLEVGILAKSTEWQYIEACICRMAL